MVIEQNNFVNQSLHTIGQQLDCIEEKIDSLISTKTAKKLIISLSEESKVKNKIDL